MGTHFLTLTVRFISMVTLFKVLPAYLMILMTQNAILGTDKVPAVRDLHFVCTGCVECSFSLPSSAFISDLRDSIAVACVSSSPFEIKLIGETIVSSQTPTNETIAEIRNVRSLEKDLHQIWGKNLRIPLTVHKTKEDITVCGSLAQMFAGSHSNAFNFEWYRFIKRCAANQACTVQDVCDRFGSHFMCDDDGKLISINLHQKLTGHIHLSFLPDTVVTLMLERNLFSGIFGLDQLVGKQLNFLDLRENPLDIDLKPLRNVYSDSMDNPLRYIRVSAYQISWSLLGIRRDTRYAPQSVRDDFSFTVQEAMVPWFRLSILNCMTLGRNRFKKTIEDDGSLKLVVFEGRNQHARNLL